METPQQYYEKGIWNRKNFADVCQRLSEKKKVYGMTIKNDWMTFFSFIYHSGGRIFSFNTDGTIMADNEALESINSLKLLIDNNYCIYMGSLPKGVTEEEMFKSEQIAMVYSGYEYTSSFKDIKDFEWDIVPFPSDAMGCRISALNIPVICAAKYSVENEAARKFISFYTGGQGQKLRLEKGEKSLPSLKYTIHFNSPDVVLPRHSNYFFYSMDEGFVEEKALNYLQNKEKLFLRFHDFWMGRMGIENIIRVN